MKPVQFEQATGTLGYTVAGRKVPVVRDHLRGETVSCWKLNALERVFALFTGRVWLRVISTSPAPASMQVRSPFRAPSGAPGKREPLSAKQLLRWVRKFGKAAVVALALAAPGVAQDLTITADGTGEELIWEEATPWNWKEVYLSNAGSSCHVYELVEASAALRVYLLKSTGDITDSVPAIYVEPPTPAEALRIEAEKIERRDAAIERWRKILAKCEAVVEVKP